MLFFQLISGPVTNLSFMFGSFQSFVWKLELKRFKNHHMVWCSHRGGVVWCGVVSANKISCCVDSWYQPPPVRPAWQAYKFIALNICSYTDSPPLIITVPHIFNNNQNFSGYTSPSDITIPFIIPQSSNCHSSHSISNSSVRDILD